MKSDWLGRIASIQFLLLYPIQSATIFPTQSGCVAYVTVGFIVAGGILLNYIFLKDIFSILISHRSLRDLYKEYAWVVIVALMNVSLFASLYHMFGINQGGKIILRDWYNSYYFSAVTWTTLGYGDLSPVESLKLVSALEAFLGYVYMAMLVGLLLNLSQHTMKVQVTSRVDD